MRIEELDTPALTVDLDIMERNLRSLSRLLPEAWSQTEAAHENAQDSSHCEDADCLWMLRDHRGKSRRS